MTTSNYCFGMPVKKSRALFQWDFGKRYSCEIQSGVTAERGVKREDEDEEEEEEEVVVAFITLFILNIFGN